MSQHGIWSILWLDVEQKNPRTCSVTLQQTPRPSQHRGQVHSRRYVSTSNRPPHFGVVSALVRGYPNPYVYVSMSQGLSGSGCSKNQENYDWTTAMLLLLIVTSNAHRFYIESVQMCRHMNYQYIWDTNKVYKLPLFYNRWKKKPCVITVYFECIKIWNLPLNTVNVWHSSYLDARNQF